MIEKQFPTATSIAKSRALGYFTQWKIINGKSDIVWSNLDILSPILFNSGRYQTAIVESLRDNFAKALREPAVARRTISLLEKQLLIHPDSQDLRMFVELSIDLGRTKEMLPTLEKLVVVKPTEEERGFASEVAKSILDIRSSELSDNKVADLVLAQLKMGVGDGVIGQDGPSLASR